MTHHVVRERVAPNVWQIARPLRDSSRLHRWQQERACRKVTGHCWHAKGMIEWWCCMCSGETDGWPAQRCIYCIGGPGGHDHRPE